MLCKRRGIGLGHHILGILQRFLCISAGHMAALAQISLFVHLWRILSHGLMDGAYGCQFLIINLDQFFCIFQDIPCLSHYQAYGIAYTPGDVTLCDHNVPVLLEMPHLIIGHVFGCQHSQYARKCHGLLEIDIQHFGPGILRTHCGGIYHSLHLHISRIFTISQHLFPHIQTECALSHAIRIPFFQGFLNLCIPSQDRCCQLDPFYDLLISGTAADISLQGKLDLLLCGIRNPVDQRLSGHYHTGSTEPALHGSHCAKSVHKGFLLRIA